LQQLASLNKKLKDKSLNRDLIDSSVEEEETFDQLGAKFTIAGDAKVCLFNSVDDKDPDQVIGTKKKDPDSDLELEPQIKFSVTNAWLKYKLGLNAKANGSHSFTDDLNFNLDLESGASLSSYRIHAPGEVLKSALKGDLTKPKYIIVPQHLHDLEIGEAVSLQTHGKLSADITLKWADVLTDQMSLLSSLLDGNEAFAIKVGASAEVNVKVLVEDDYALIISRSSRDWWRVAVKKADTRNIEGSVGLSIAAEFTDQPAVKKVLNDVVEGLLGESIANINKILNATNLDNLGNTEKKIAEKLLDRLGLEDSSKLQEKLTEFKKDVECRIQKIAELKASLSFSYEYKRLHSNQTVLQAKMKEALLDTYYENLLKGNLGDLMEALRTDAPNLELEKFLNVDTLKISKSWGFGLAIGNWSAKGRDKSELERIVKTDINDHKQVSFLGVRGYASKWGKEEISWQTDFDASMDGFSGTTMPTANEFDYAFSISYETKNPSDKKIARRIDHGVIWGAINIEEAEEITNRLSTELRGASDITYTHLLKFGKEAFGPLILNLSVNNTSAFGSALATAMPWSNHHAIVRQNPILRQRVFGGLWTAYLNGEITTPAGMAASAKATLKKMGFSNLASTEGDHWKINRTSTIAGLADLNRHTMKDWHAFVEGARSIMEARSHQSPYNPVIKKAVKKMRRLGSQSHYIRALGVYLMDLFRSRPDIEKGVERTLTVTYTKNGEKQSEIFSIS
jgi:hypothetical protein